MPDLETMIRDIIRSELKQLIPNAAAAPTSKATTASASALTPGQKAARTRKLREAGRKAWVTRRRNAAR
jgi:D-aminopeptidase